MARDPLSAANAFNIYIRCVLATILGVRMCPDCPHCVETNHPCQDALGSSAEIMGGLAGRGDAIFGAVESQKTTMSLHLHLWFFGQRIHQYSSLEEIAQLLQLQLLDANDFKDFLNNLCCETYPDLAQHNAEIATLEKQWPKFTEMDEEKNASIGSTRTSVQVATDSKALALSSVPQGLANNALILQHKSVLKQDKEKEKCLPSVPQGLVSNARTRRQDTSGNYAHRSLVAVQSVPQGLDSKAKCRRAAKIRWGSLKLGRIPQFVYQDKGPGAFFIVGATSREQISSLCQFC